ncbi:MAG: c-type cytochrome biogenesis protein CcmI [Gallionellaceae bacterium]|nr:c-type cytochrome biogenesis protein CcmI [Gallionellaceae bacterium]
MVVFWAVASVLVVVALLVLAAPLLGLGKRRSSATLSEVNLSVYRDQLRELDAELASGILDQTQYLNARNELEGRVLEDSGSPNIPAAATGNRWPTAGVVALVVAIPILAISLYLVLGTPAGLDPQSQKAEPQAATEGQPHAVTQEQIEAMVTRLAEKMASRPDDAEGWLMLARSYTALRRYEEAGKAYAKVAKMLPEDAPLLADYADVLAMSKRTLQGEPEKIIHQALKIDPNNIKALSLAGSVAFERKDYRNAIKWWENILKLAPGDSQLATSITTSINEARGLAGLPPLSPQANNSTAARAGTPGKTVSGTVNLSPALKARVSDNDSVFIFARAAQGPRMPLAVIRKTVKDLPVTFTLNDSMAVMPSLKLSSVPNVIIGARISKTGSATPTLGDLQGSSQPVKVGAKGVAITIDSEVK